MGASGDSDHFALAGSCRMIAGITIHGSRQVLPALVWLACHGSIVLANSPPVSIWETDLSAACGRAQAEATPLVVYLSSSADEAHASSCREFERGPLASPAMDGFRNWAVLARVDVAAPVPDETVAEMLRAVDLSETPAVAVVVRNRDGWRTHGQSIGKFEPPDLVRIVRGDIAQAMIALCCDEYEGMTARDRNRHRKNVVGRCMLLQRESEAIENSYNLQLATLRDDGRFSAKKFATTAQERQSLLQRWILAVAELSALPECRNGLICEVVLNQYLLEHDVSRRLSTDLVACTANDHLAGAKAIKTAHKLVRARDCERELGSQTVQAIVATAGQTRWGRSEENSEMQRKASGKSAAN
jgi:hypothetical protein